jgi:class 3 adenylate cyclase
MDAAPNPFSTLRDTVHPDAAAAIEALVRHGDDAALNRINVLEFAQAHGLRVDQAIGAFLHAARLGLFDMSWNLLCPGCGGVLDAHKTLQAVRCTEYACALCAAGYQPSLDEMVEVSFTVSPRLRRIAAHDPETLSLVEYSRQMYWSSGIRLPEGDQFGRLLQRIVIDSVELPAGRSTVRELELPAAFVIVFDPVTHTSRFIDVQGEPTAERRELGVVMKNEGVSHGTVVMAPGPLRLTLENHTAHRTLPGVYIAGHDLHDLLGQRKPFLTGKRLLTNQTFRDLYRTEALDIDQRLKITSLTFLFSDLIGSTAMYERVGDLAAFELVKSHFRLLHDVIGEYSGAVVKTIGDAVMATFPSPDLALAAGLRMRVAVRALGRAGDELTLKLGLHEGPCLAVMLNDRLDYFGQTVNIAARVQGLAGSDAIFATGPVVSHPDAARLLAAAGITPVTRQRMLKGITDAYTVYEIP